MSSGALWMAMTLNFDDSLVTPWKCTNLEMHTHTHNTRKLIALFDAYHDEIINLNASVSNYTRQMNGNFHEYFYADLESKFRMNGSGVGKFMNMTKNTSWETLFDHRCSEEEEEN